MKKLHNSSSTYQLATQQQQLIHIFCKYSDTEIEYIQKYLTLLDPLLNQRIQNKYQINIKQIHETQYLQMLSDTKKINVSCITIPSSKHSDAGPIIFLNSTVYFSNFSSLLEYLSKSLSIELPEYIVSREKTEGDKSKSDLTHIAINKLKRLFISNEKRAYVFMDLTIINNSDGFPNKNNSKNNQQVEKPTALTSSQINKKNRIIIELYCDVAPKTCNNFINICNGFEQNQNIENSSYIGKHAKLTYKFCPFHRIIKNQYIQGGKLDEKGGQSIYGQYFEDENKSLKHDKPGMIGMAHVGKRSLNGSQFYITFHNDLKSFDGKYVVFGQVVKGLKILKRINKNQQRDSQIPTDQVIITNCGTYQFGIFMPQQQIYLMLIKQQTQDQNDFNDDLVRVFNTYKMFPQINHQVDYVHHQQEERKKRKEENEKFQSLRPAEKLIYGKNLSQSVDREDTSSQNTERHNKIYLPSINQSNQSLNNLLQPLSTTNKQFQSVIVSNENSIDFGRWSKTRGGYANSMDLDEMSIRQKSRQGNGSLYSSVNQRGYLETSQCNFTLDNILIPDIEQANNNNKKDQPITDSVINNNIIRKTKIVCTIGPSCIQVDTIVSMIDAGMNIARINLSHGDFRNHMNILKSIRAAQSQRPNSPISIMLDTRGPSVRTGLLKGHRPIKLQKDQTLHIINHDYDTFLGDANTISCNYYFLSQSVKIGQTLLISDGQIQCSVISFDEVSGNVVVKVENDSQLSEHQSIALPNSKILLPTITKKDEFDLVNIAIKQHVDAVALSFVRTAQDIIDARTLLGLKRKDIQIIAKIEDYEGISNFESILQEADGIMVARGDLGVQLPSEKVFKVQKWIISLSNQAGKPVITSTQMLESMIKSPRPTRAEASDVANAVLDGSDAIMLTSETAIGQYPKKCVETLANICKEAEFCINYHANFLKKIQPQKQNKDQFIPENVQQFTALESLAISAIQQAFESDAPILITLTKSGYMASLCAQYRPKALIVSVSLEASAFKFLNIHFGVRFLQVPNEIKGVNKIISYAIEWSTKMGFCKTGDTVVILTGRIDEDFEGQDIIKTMLVPDYNIQKQ